MTCVIGEGGSGGAVAIAVADRVLMQENAIYSVISPEGCAAILWRDAGEAKKAAAAFKPDARHCLELGVVDGIVPEPEGGAHTDHDQAATLLAESVRNALAELDPLDPDERRRLRRAEVPRHGHLPRLEVESPAIHSVHRVIPGGPDSLPCGKSGWSERDRGHASAMARLKEYERKRHRGATPEPFGGGGGGERPIFVVQRHDARRLHYDFRLERDGALASWAVPKGVPLEPGQRHLAVHVEDHPLDYAAFEGEIPAGQYGAGTVEIWDRGTYELVEEKPDGGLTVRLEGERLDGTWTLVPAALDGDEKNWLLIRKRDEAAPRARPARTYQPMLATLAKEVPAGPEWLYEVKWDGYRAIGAVGGGEATLTSRRGNDLTSRFAYVARALQRDRADARLRRRRRGLRAGRARAVELLRHAAGLRAARLLRVRRAGGRRGGRSRRCRSKSGGSAWASCSTCAAESSASRRPSTTGGPARGGRKAGARGRARQEARIALPARRGEPATGSR